MYYVKTMHGDFGPFKRYAEALKWQKAVTPNLLPTSEIRLMWEPLPWATCEAILGANMKSTSSEKEQNEPLPLGSQPSKRS